MFKEGLGERAMVFKPTQRLHLGAEAEVWKGEWFVNRPSASSVVLALVPEPRPSPRRPSNDVANLVDSHRKAGLSVPSVWDLDYEGGQLIIEHLNGRPLIDLLNDEATTAADAQATLQRVGAAVRQLHREATTHGDLSSNNILIEGEQVHLIDFGLASIEYDVERFGIDLHVLDEILGASHPQWEGAIDWVVDGYMEAEDALGPAPTLQGGAVPTAREVQARLEDIRTRVRYHG